MENYTFDLMVLPQDKAEINDWQNRYAGTKGWKNIEEYILENGLIYNLDELINTNYEIIPIGDYERKMALSVKNQNKEIVGFVICQEFEILSPFPELFLQYVVIRPDMQNKNVGTYIFKNLANKIEQTTGARPAYVFSYIHSTNLASQKLYKKFGFEFKSMQNCNSLVRAVGSFEKELEK